MTVYPVVKQPGREVDRSNLVSKILEAKPPLVHMPCGVMLQLSTGDFSVLRIEIFTTVIIKNAFPNGVVSEHPVISILRVL